MVKKKICLVSSRGGHLFQVWQVKAWWAKYDRFWITGRGKDSQDMLEGEKVYYGYFPESRNIINALKNLVVGWHILSQERPEIIFSVGAGIAPPIFLVGKIFGCKLIYLEPYDFVSKPSLTGRLVYLLADKFLVQHQHQKRFFDKAEYWGAVL